MTELRITVRNLSDDGGVFLTPVYFGFHDGSFDLFDAGATASPGLEALAEDGNFSVIAGERQAADADSQGLVVTGAAGPIATQEMTSATIDVDGVSNGFASFGAMILPSNDAFIGTDQAVQLFDAYGRFTGEQTITFAGSDVYDAGTEVNTELDAAFINQMGPNTGVDENGVITQHPGFNGSLGNPVGEGDQIILGGTNAFGEAIDPVAADFTQPGAQIAEVHINTVVERTGTDKRDVIIGRGDDDIVDAGAGRDFIFTRGGWDVVDAGAGNDKVFGGAGVDVLHGGAGRDWINGGRDDDYISGGTGRDFLIGGRGDDVFIFNEGDGNDKILDFDRRGDDRLLLNIEGVDSFEDVLDAVEETWKGVTLDFDDAGSITLAGVDADELSASDFLFA